MWDTVNKLLNDSYKTIHLQYKSLPLPLHIKVKNQIILSPQHLQNTNRPQTIIWIALRKQTVWFKIDDVLKFTNDHININHTGEQRRLPVNVVTIMTSVPGWGTLDTPDSKSDTVSQVD